MTNRIPVRYAEGPEEATVWVWADTPESTAVTIDRDTWDEFLEKAEREYDGDLERLFGDYVAAFNAGKIEL